MERGRFLVQTLAVSVSLFLFGPRDASAKEDDGFTMSSGPLVGGANGTEGA